MKLLDNWKEVLGKSWTVWLFIIIAIVSAAHAALAEVDPRALGISPRTYSITMAILSLLGIFLRIINQSLSAFIKDEAGQMSRRGVAGITALSIAASAAFVAPWEGLRNHAYRDIVGVWTVCYGETKGVQPGDHYTDAECEAMLSKELRAYAAGLSRCITHPVPEGMGTALVSWAYNVGTGAACRSTLVRKLNAGDLRGACNELPRWNKAGGREVPGLTNRRAAEQRLCLKSVASVEAAAAAEAAKPAPWWRFW